MQEEHIYAKTARKAVTAFLTEGKRLKKPDNSEPEFSLKHSCFTSIHTKNGNLRGCIGTIEPQFDNLFNEIVQNAISAATRDPRFNPVKVKELDSIYFTVDVLSEPEITTPNDLDPKRFGLIITDGYYKGVLLPNLEGVDTAQQQIDIVKRKAGIAMQTNDELTFLRFTSTRYA
ncbi:MAG: AmmeMemoRadiSam system protein A [Salinivirgaceae bacterium]|jgi:AmmeMemoRadiSam system protein A|nr:AmmeMemoRadiSam system protein A [Salinivirgaceae bacterium]